MRTRNKSEVIHKIESEHCTANYVINNILKGRVPENLIFVHVVAEPVKCKASVLTFQLIHVGYQAEANKIKVTPFSEHVTSLEI
jgi:hypothetical protein